MRLVTGSLFQYRKQFSIRIQPGRVAKLNCETSKCAAIRDGVFSKIHTVKGRLVKQKGEWL